MKTFFLLVALGCLMLLNPVIVLLAALVLYVANRLGAALKRKPGRGQHSQHGKGEGSVYPAAPIRPSAFIAPRGAFEHRFRVISGGNEKD